MFPNYGGSEEDDPEGEGVRHCEGTGDVKKEQEMKSWLVEEE